MGSWHLEVMRMTIYMAFPVGLFYYFNQPEYFEKWVVETRREIYPPANLSKEEDMRRFIEQHKSQKKEELRRKLEELDSKQSSQKS